MKKFTLKILASYVGLYAIINAGWGVSVFYLIPFSLSSQRWLLATEGFLVWFLTLLFALSILSYKVRIIQRTLTAVDKGRDLSDRDILDTLKKSSDLPLFGMFLYSVMTVITVIVTFVIWKMTGIGTISAAAIFVALLPGGVTCASMQFAAFTLLTIKGNDRLTLIAVQKKLQPETTTIGIRSKAYLSVGLLGVGVALWMFGFAYYSVVNKVVDETKVTSLAFHTVLAETFSASEHDGDLLNQLKNRIIHAPFGNSGFMFLADRQGKFLAIPEQKTLFVEHWPEINQQIRQDFKSLTANSIYDNVDEKIITYTPVGDAYMLGTVEYLIGKLPTTRIWIWGGIYGLPAFLVTIILGWSLSSTILHSIHAVSSSIRALSQGKLFIRHGTSNFDETGILVLTINRFSEELSGTIEHIITIANDVSASSGHVRDIAEQVAQRSTQQAASAEEVSASMEEMSSSIRMNSDNSQHAKQEAKQVSERIAHVKTAVVDTKLAMQNIVKKISVINEFSRKTNLLSLNAAVEAARAGDAGKGFAVLASEIRALAEQSLRAVQTIEEVSQTSLTQAEYSEKLLEESLPSILSTTDLVQEIAAASMEQSSGTILINQSVQDLASVTQQNSASAETMASNSDVLTQHASTLLETISLFKTSEDDLQRMSETELKRKLEILTSQLHTVQSARQNREETPLETAQRPRRGNTSF